MKHSAKELNAQARACIECRFWVSTPKGHTDPEYGIGLQSFGHLYRGVCIRSKQCESWVAVDCNGDDRAGDSLRCEDGIIHPELVLKTVINDYTSLLNNPHVYPTGRDRLLVESWQLLRAAARELEAVEKQQEKARNLQHFAEVDDHNSRWGGAGPDCCRIPA